jgi:hypothetical protein
MQIGCALSLRTPPGFDGDERKAIAEYGPSSVLGKKSAT